MNFDFNLIIVPATVILTLVWLLDVLVLKQRATRGRGNEHFVIGWGYDFWWILAFVVTLRAFLFEPFNIPSSSMKPTLITNDYVVVNKHEYALRLPLLHTKVLGISQPKRGDVVVFRETRTNSIYFIKRVIGVPGDVVRYKDGVLSINGEALPTTELPAQATDGYSRVLEQVITDQQGNKISFTIRDLIGVESAYQSRYLIEQNPDVLPMHIGDNWKLTVPQGHYFVMGDNRDESSDSRFWGFVPEKNIAGKATYVWTHKKPGLNMPDFSQAREIH